MPKLVRLRPEGDPVAGLAPSDFIDPATIEGPAPVERAHVAFRNAAGNLTAGTWDVTPYVEIMDGYPIDELVVIVSGRVTITDKDGVAEIFGPGDVFIVPRGFRGRWENTEPVRKFFMYLE